MNPEKLDKILISSSDLRMLSDWWLNIHEGEFNEFRSVLEEGMIELIYSKEELSHPKAITKNVMICFKQLSERIVHYEIYRTIKSDDKIEFILKAMRNYEENKSTVELNKDNGLKIAPEKAMSFFEKMSEIHVSLMNYMELYKEVKEKVNHKKVRTSVNKKTSKGKKKKNTRPIIKTVYSINIPNAEITEEERRAYKKMKESWGVRGHWRMLKGGRKVWIRPHIKGDKEKVEPTTYTF